MMGAGNFVFFIKVCSYDYKNKYDKYILT
jgi:hypothetical protein